jgi:hypothetical protein
MPRATPKLELKDKFIQAVIRKAKLDPPTSKLDSRDLLPNFRFRIYPDCTASFVVIARAKGAANPTTITVGHYPDLSLAAAREQARDIIANLKRGVTPNQTTTKK